jgi:hypothetical protein
MSPARLKRERLNVALTTFILGHDLAVKAGMHKDCSLSAAHAKEARRERVRFGRLWLKAAAAEFERTTKAR